MADYRNKLRILGSETSSKFGLNSARPDLQLWWDTKYRNVCCTIKEYWTVW